MICINCGDHSIMHVRYLNGKLPKGAGCANYQAGSA